MVGCVSLWRLESSGVPQRSVLSVNYVLDGKIVGWVSKFADDIETLPIHVQMVCSRNQWKMIDYYIVMLSTMEDVDFWEM